MSMRPTWPSPQASWRSEAFETSSLVLLSVSATCSGGVLSCIDPVGAADRTTGPESPTRSRSSPPIPLVRLLRNRHLLQAGRLCNPPSARLDRSESNSLPENVGDEQAVAPQRKAVRRMTDHSPTRSCSRLCASAPSLQLCVRFPALPG